MDVEEGEKVVIIDVNEEEGEEGEKEIGDQERLKRKEVERDKEGKDEIEEEIEDFRRIEVMVN